MKEKNKYYIDNLINTINNRNLLPRFAFFIWGLLLYAASFSVFFEQFNIVTGGSAGLSIIIGQFINIDNSLFVFMFSFVLLIIGYFLLGKLNAIRTVFGVILFPIFMKFTSLFPNVFNFHISSMFLTVFFGGVIMGIGNGLIMRSGFSVGGFQTLYQILYKYMGIAYGKSTFILNSILVIVSGFIFGYGNSLYALIGLFVSSKLTDRVLLETSISKTFYIVTDKHKEINQYIVDNLHHSATVMDAKGGFSNDNKKMILCCVPSREYYMAKQIINDIDPNSFMLITDTYEIRGGM